jgi:hypothetical protein
LTQDNGTAENGGFSTERRSHSRFGKDLWARYRVRGASSPAWLEARVLNLSHAGLCLAITDDRRQIQPLVDVTDRPQIELDIPLDSENNELATGMFKVLSSIRWIRKPGLLSRTLLVGLEFGEHPEEMKRLLREYIKAQFLATYQETRDADQDIP